MRQGLLAAVLLVLVTSGRPAQAGFVAADKFTLSAAETPSWGALGAEWTTLPNGFTITTALGVTGTITAANGGSFQVVNQGSAFLGNFSPGDPLLWNMGNGQVTIDFGPDGVYGGGAQIQYNHTAAFLARVEALDGSGNVLASFTRDGVSNSLGDGSAIFIGVMSDTPNIFKLRFSLDNALQDFVLGNVSVSQVDPKSGATPEPGSLALAGVGLGAALAAGWRARRRRRPA